MSSPEAGQWDEQMQSHVVQVSDEWIVSVTPQIFNALLCLTGREEYPYTYTAGWHYEDVVEAVAAAAAWDVAAEREPSGYIKCACDARPAREQQ